LLQAALQQPPTKTDRLHLLLLANNVSIAPPEQPICWQQRTLLQHTELFAQQASSSSSSKGQGNGQGNAAPSSRGELVSLALGFMRDSLLLPAAAGDKFLLVQNISMGQLPQGPGAAAAAGMGWDKPSPPDVWTLLLWSINRLVCSGKGFGDLLLPCCMCSVRAVESDLETTNVQQCVIQAYHITQLIVGVHVCCLLALSICCAQVNQEVVCLSAGVPVCWCACLLVCLSAGVPVCWCACLLVCLSAGVCAAGRGRAAR
jgi:hypothetical protein